ncbi:haloacid dehalogenase-like hydrolase [Amycolatopsis anabasis]|uniref:haloacid dehalogenase-like hydrolase n=1 Tax=Amycolatopsis anabasis TaxID=1840409 RepID=UPI001FE491E4|nr:haloacid dehalogenase-like hydrolase [Amycolatopsis anabasis]
MAVATATTAPSAAAAPASAYCPQLRLADHWYGGNAAKIQRVIDERGRCGKPRGPRPVAVFDWDNTVIKNDISDQTVFWMLRHDKVLQPKDADWRNTSRYLTEAGADALRKACGTTTPPGRPLSTSTNTACADEILSVRKDGKTTGGAEVFDGTHNHRQMQAGYAWVAQINAGYRPSEVRAIARRARAEALSAPIGATQRVGSHTEVAWIRYYPEIKDLIATLNRAGFETWVVSASPKETADVWSAGVGIPPSRTIGIGSLTTNGRINGHLEGCGGIPDGADAIMPYIDGKRCFINKTILGIDGKAQLDPAPEPRRQALAGGDATTDVTMLSDATGVRIALNRNKDELMCRAYDNADGKWAINPMFIEPLPALARAYPCSTTGYENPDGSTAPVRRADGSTIPDQRDTIHG